jgi:hypothetical protein
MNIEIALFSGLVGALSVFVLGWLKGLWESERQLEGLLRLIYREIDFNERNGLPIIQATLWNLGDDIKDKKIGIPLNTDVWQQSRVRIAQLLRDREGFGEMVVYYMNVQTVNHLLAPPDIGVQRYQSLKNCIPDLYPQGVKVREWIESTYLGDQNATWRKIFIRVTGRDIRVR